MNRRDVLSTLAAALPLSALSSALQLQQRSGPPRHESHGSGPVLIIGSPISSSSAPGAERTEPIRAGYLNRLTDYYRVILMDYPSADEDASSFTPERVTADMLAVADAAGADRFAWFGFSWGGVVGLQLAARTNRLTALICGGWPPLAGPYASTLATAEALAVKVPGARMMVTYYRALQDWAEREAVSSLTVPRMTFAGSQDTIFDAGSGKTTPIGPLIAQHRAKLEKIGWTVRLVDGYGHELVNRPDMVVPLIREFLDPILLSR
jgi:pimeloyl-ACP methyl ester carboxylesterase